MESVEPMLQSCRVLDSRDQFVALAIAAASRVTPPTVPVPRPPCPASLLPAVLVSAEIGRRWVTATAAMVTLAARVAQSGSRGLPGHDRDGGGLPEFGRDDDEPGGAAHCAVCFGVSFTGGVTTRPVACHLVPGGWPVMCVAWVDDVTAVEKSLYTNPHAVLLPTRNGEVVTSQLLGIRWDWDDASATLIANRRWVVALSYGSLFMWKVVPLGDDFGGARRRTTVDYKSEKVVGVGPGKAYSDVGVWQFTRCPRDKGSEVGDVLSIGLFRNGRLDYMQVDLKKTFETGTLQVIFSQNSIECSHGMKRLVFPGGLQQGKECIVDGSFIRDISTGEKHMEFPPESVVYAVDDTHVGVVRLDHNVFPLAVFEVYNLENSASCCSEAQAIHSGIKYKETESGGGLFLKCTTTMPTVQVVDAFTGVVVFQMKRCDAANFTLHVQDLS